LVKILLIITAFVAAISLSIGVYVNSSIDFPSGTEDIIESVFNSELPELISGETGVVDSSGVEIWYESLSKVEKPKATIVLSMGAVAGALAWPEHFYTPLLEAGYRVIRYDHRGLGMSSWMPDWTRETAYNLEDMALDVVAILDELKIDKVHFIGMSMGGMIGQSLAINHSERLLSFASISSSADLHDPELTATSTIVSIEMVKLFLKYGLFPSEKNIVKMEVGFSYLCKGNADYEVDVRAVSEFLLYEQRRRQGINDLVWKQHTAAIEDSGSRYDELRNITVPTLVVHGSSDRIIPIAHAKKYAGVIKAIRTLWLKGMGHDLPKQFMPKITTAILENIERATR